jgi:membrane-bound lytic murein transglycosylase D
MIESGYETNATSSASAVGIWQFMAGTARAEGLEVSEWLDERRDPYRSTDAAIRHLSGLYKQFGSWYLAAAAYNSGSGRISRLLKEYGRNKGPDETFWALQDELPQETRGYVPGLVVAAIIGEYPQLFGLDDVVPDAPVQFDMVVVPQSTSLGAVARASGSTTEEIRRLNPQFFRGATPPDHESHVRVPAGASAGFVTAFAKIPREDRIASKGRTHIVRAGETLSEIADHYGTTVEALQRANRIKRPEAVGAGRKLTIPTS